MAANDSTITDEQEEYEDWIELYNTSGKSPDWFRIPAEFSSNLPIVVINTGGREIPNEPRIVVDMGVIYSGSDKKNFLTDPYNHYNGKISIELRGNTTLDFPKKAYALETQNEDGSNRNVSLLGLPAENDWILYAPYSDKSLMRNVLTFQLANEMGRYAPRTRYCELFLNGDYRGIYVLMEKIKRDSNRVNIAKLTPADTTGDALTGGYILKLDWWDPKSAGWDSEIDGTLFHYHHPQKKDLLPVQRDYIKDYMIDFENVLASVNYLDPQKGYRSYIEIGSFVDFFMSAEVSHNADSYRLSTFMYKERDNRGGKLSMGPLWDYNLAYGNQDEGPFGTPYEWSWEIGLDPINFWWEKFLSDPVFTNSLQERWWELRENIFTDDHIHAIIDSVASYLDEAQQRNFERWPVLGEWVWPNYYVGQTYEDEVRYLKNWIIKRLVWMDEHIPELGDEAVPPDTGNGIQVCKKVQIFPNPSASNTTIRYQLNFPRYVKINIYNSLGQRIKKLVDLYQEPEEYVATWDGTNQDGVPVAGGIYFCVLELNYEVVSVSKLVKF